ncbi:hypothetical protein DFH06DRAFT_1146008 [Mycena polygramma]|nr:hypothetical protein DFH06DRAFT_1146008 [Mycena polygramma]
MTSVSISRISANRLPRHSADFIPLIRSLIPENNPDRHAGAKPSYGGSFSSWQVDKNWVSAASPNVKKITFSHSTGNHLTVGYARARKNTRKFNRKNGTDQQPELRNLECGGTVRKQGSFQDKVIAKELEFVTKSNPREGRGKRNRVIREQIQRRLNSWVKAKNIHRERNSKELEFVAKSKPREGRGKSSRGGKKQQGHWERDSKELKFVTESNAREGRGKKQLGDWEGGSKELEFGAESTKAMSGSDSSDSSGYQQATTLFAYSPARERVRRIPLQRSEKGPTVKKDDLELILGMKRTALDQAINMGRILEKYYGATPRAVEVVNKIEGGEQESDAVGSGALAKFLVEYEKEHPVE